MNLDTLIYMVWASSSEYTAIYYRAGEVMDNGPSVVTNVTWDIEIAHGYEGLELNSDIIY